MRRFPVDDGERQALRACVLEVLQAEPGIVLAYLHGSFADPSTDHVGDLDLAVLLEGSPSRDGALEEELRLEGIIDRAVDVPVDLRVLNHAPLTFRFGVLRDGERVICRSQDARDRFECGTLALYHDFSYHLETYRREALGLGT